MPKCTLTSLGCHPMGPLRVKRVLLLGLAALMLAASVPTAEAVVCARGIYTCRMRGLGYRIETISDFLFVLASESNHRPNQESKNGSGP
jgi:hypothetical protein